MTTAAKTMGRDLSLITLNKGVQLLGGMLWAVIVPRWLGPEAYGQFTLAMATSLLLWWVADFGGLEVFGRHIPALQAQDPARARQLFGQAFLLRLLVAMALPFAMLVAGPLIAPWLRGWPAALVGLAAGLHILSWSSFHLLYARKEMGKWAAELSWRLMTQLPLVLVVGRWGLTAQMAAYTANELIYLGLALWWTRHWFSREALRPALAFLRPYLRMGGGFWATNIGLIVLFRTGTLLVQIHTGDSAQVSYFDLALTVFFLIHTIIDQLLRAFLPTISGFQEEGQGERVGQWLQVVAQWGAALAVIAVIAVQYTADFILPIILGAAFGDAAAVLRVMLLSLPALALVGVGTVATAVRQSPRAKLIAIAAGILSFWLSSVWLVEHYAAMGAAWALTLGLNVYALTLFAQVRRDLRVPARALLGLLLLGLPFLTLRGLVAADLLLALAASLLAALLYLGAGMLLRILSPQPFIKLLPRLFSRAP
ncbi:MAG: lipopolysaccharide biosynthesis protein [Caldilineales bacterium]|nr:lipopolysaccharide biosynthesis protein [Caldilineales bacterium]